MLSAFLSKNSRMVYNQPMAKAAENSRYNDRKHRIFEIIQIGNRTDTISRFFDYFIMAMIILNIVALFAGTFEPVRNRCGTLLEVIEAVTVIVFIVEYILRLWTACYLYPNETPGRAALHFMRSFDGVVQLLTILPFFFLSGFVVFRMMRVVRILRLFKINANFDSFNVITSVLYEKRKQLVSSVFIVLLLMFASSLCMYSAEHAAQPEAFKNAFSGIWWSVSTLLTVGYGDIYPITLAGKIMAIIISFLGVGMVAIPTGIISAGFVEQYTEMSNNTSEGDINLQSVIIDVDSAWIGRTIEEIEHDFGYAIVLTKRGNATFLPSKSDNYIVQAGDSLVVYRHVSQTVQA